MFILNCRFVHGARELGTDYRCGKRKIKILCLTNDRGNIFRDINFAIMSIKTCEHSFSLPLRFERTLISHVAHNLQFFFII
jgi:hypothetical protein